MNDMRIAALFLMASSALAAGCYMAAGTGTTPPGDDAGADAGTVQCSSSWTGAETVLVGTCQSCHGSTPAGGATVSLVTPADMKAPAKTKECASLNEAQCGIKRMLNGEMPVGGGANTMAGPLEAWVDAGYPACETTPSK